MERAWPRPCRLGIDALRVFLQELLDQHIEKELPKVRKDIKALLTRTEGNLANLGDERPTIGHIRMFLTRLSMKFHSLTQAALDGNYHWTDHNFFKTSEEDWSPTRLRAELHSLNGEFSTYMRVNGQKRKLCKESDSDAESDAEAEQLCVTKQEYDAWIKQV